MTTFSQMYTFDFPPITTKPSTVWYFNDSNHQKYSACISINDHQLLTKGDVLLPSLLADLVDISVAVHLVDRAIKRNIDYSYNFDLHLPVRNPDFFCSEEITNLFKETLFWFTEDHWNLIFSCRKPEKARQPEIQPHLSNFINPPIDTEVALWSGGLDSVAGLFNRIKQNPKMKYILVGTGSNNQNFLIQENVANLVSGKFNNSIDLIQIPYQIELPNINSKTRNRYQRSRGFTFMLIGAATAYLKGQRKLYIYENGVGAINLPYSESEIGLDHTRSVNPISVNKMSLLITKILGEQFQIHNPYLFWTKAEMCKDLVESGETELISSTKSCDSQQRNKECGVIQCGVCSSCILRRMALEFWGFPDPTVYLHSKFYTPTDENFIRAMMYQVKNLQTALKSENAWLSLSNRFVILENVVDILSLDDKNNYPRSYYEEQLVRLYSTYCKEWAQVQRQGASFLKKRHQEHVSG